MRIAALSLIVLLATPADAAAPKVPQAPTPSPAAATGLRGPVSTTPKTAPISLIPTASTAPADLPQCRQTCAHTYYFCLAGEGAGDCPQSWTSCLADCERPSPPLQAGSE